MTPVHREWKIEGYTLNFEPPDLLMVEFRGPLSMEGTIRLVDVYREVAESQPYFMVADMKEAEPLDPECGRYISEHVSFEWVRGVIYVGGRLVNKAVAKGIVLAAQLPEQQVDPRTLAKIHFVSTMDQAHHLIARMRAQDMEVESADPSCMKKPRKSSSRN
jgi:hypothetical protein